jgi:hypothetical protein
MSKLNDFLKPGGKSQQTHPKVRYWRQMLESGHAVRIVCEFRRPRSGLGFEPARLYVSSFDKSGHQLAAPDEVTWEIEIDAELVELGARATDMSNEGERTGMRFGARFSQLESEYGSGWFKGVLVREVEEVFDGAKLVKKILDAIGPVMQSSTSHPQFAKCVGAIDGVIEEQAHALIGSLKYPEGEARNILDSAMAYFLDEKFMVTSRQLLGF